LSRQDDAPAQTKTGALTLAIRSAPRPTLGIMAMVEEERRMISARAKAALAAAKKPCGRVLTRRLPISLRSHRAQLDQVARPLPQMAESPPNT
jgi:hypothetical protein